jgi:hypothetical protein
VLSFIQPTPGRVKGSVWATSHLYSVGFSDRSLYLHMKASQRSEASLSFDASSPSSLSCPQCQCDPATLECSGSQSSVTDLPLHCPLDTNPPVSRPNPIQHQEFVMFVIPKLQGREHPKIPQPRLCKIGLAQRRLQCQGRRSSVRSGNAMPGARTSLPQRWRR